MKERLSEELLAMRVVKDLQPGDYCNLGLGTPQLCASYMPESVKVHTENGAIGYGPLLSCANPEMVDPDLMDAGGKYFSPAPGMSLFDILTSFAIIRSGRLTTILGGLQVSVKGDLAIHTLSEADEYPQIGGAMDLAWGAKRVLITMSHNTKRGAPKILKELSLPVSARGCVDTIFTDLAVIKVTPQGLLLQEYAPGWTISEIQALTGAPLSVADNVREIEF